MGSKSSRRDILKGVGMAGASTAAGALAVCAAASADAAANIQIPAGYNLLGPLYSSYVPIGLSMPSAVKGGDQFACTLVVDQTVQDQDLAVDLGFNPDTVIGQPHDSTVYIPVGQDYVTFFVDTVAVSDNTTLTVTTTVNVLNSISDTITVTP